jgi:hypothetical protein
LPDGFDQAWLDARQQPREGRSGSIPATLKAPKVSKHRNRKTVLDGLTFDSAKEAKRWQELSLWQQVGAIRDLRRQVSFDLWGINGERVARYIADAVYWDIAKGCEVREDTKSEWTRRLPVYRLKAKLMAAQGQPITEV